MKGGEDKADRGKGGKTTSGNGQAWSSPRPRGQIQLMRPLVTPIFMYACESWTFTTELLIRIRAMEMRCYRIAQDTTHLIQRPCYQPGSPCQDPACNRTTRRSSDAKRRRLQWYKHVSRSSGLAKTILQGTVKGGEDKADRRKGGKTTSGNGQAWSSPRPRGQWKTEKNGGN